MLRQRVGKVYVEEQDQQIALVEYCRIFCWPTCVVFAIPNGGYRSPKEGPILKAMGVAEGFPDLGFLHKNVARFLELKATDRNKPTKAQRDMQDKLQQAGFDCEIAYGFDHAIRIIERWGLFSPRRNAQSLLEKSQV